MNTPLHQRLNRFQRRLHRRLATASPADPGRPALTADGITYDLAGRARGLAHGGIGAIHLLAKRLGLADAIDRRLHVLTQHRPYHESDHVLIIAFNALGEGTCLQDIEFRRTDEVFLDALGAARLPDPTTAGDFCRRFTPADITALQGAIDDARLAAWAGQPPAFFDRAVIDMDGTLTATAGRCKQGMDIAYDGTWGYHPLVLSLANTREVLSLVNRPGNRPSHEGAAAEVDHGLDVCFRGGFRRVLLRGDTDVSQTEHLDRWNADDRVRFVFGYDARPNLVDIAAALPERAWAALDRPTRPDPLTGPRRRPEDVKDRVVREREFLTLRLRSEQVAEFNYRPSACAETYRMVVVRKNISREKGEARLFDEVRHFFYLTNDWVSDPAEVVFTANDRCDQENLLAQLHGGCHALSAPVNTLVANWAYMVMTALAWNLKAWFALAVPEPTGPAAGERGKAWVLGLEFRTFVQVFVRLPCQLIRTGRRLVFRVLSWGRHHRLFFRVVSALRR